MDKFKQVNDTFGHATGDKVIEMDAATLKAQTRDNDLVARLGGDEFGIVMPEITTENAVTVLSRLRERLNAVMKEQGWPVTASMGVNMIEKLSSIDDIINSADQLMFNVKRAGGNDIQFNKAIITV